MRVGVRGVDLDDAELVGERDRLADRGDGRRQARFDVRVDHLAEVHAVDVVGADDDDDVGLLVVDEVEALQDRVGRAREPALAEPLLRGHRGDVGVQQPVHAPRLRDVPVEAVRLVLGEHDDLPQTRVQQVRQREVDESVLPAERHRRLGAVFREGHEPLALAAGEDDAEYLARDHAPSVVRRARAFAGLRRRTMYGCRCASVAACASTCSPASIRPRSTEVRACTSPNSCGRSAATST